MTNKKKDFMQMSPQRQSEAIFLEIKKTNQLLRKLVKILENKKSE